MPNYTTLLQKGNRILIYSEILFKKMYSRKRAHHYCDLSGHIQVETVTNPLG